MEGVHRILWRVHVIAAVTHHDEVVVRPGQDVIPQGSGGIKLVRLRRALPGGDEKGEGDHLVVVLLALVGHLEILRLLTQGSHVWVRNGDPSSRVLYDGFFLRAAAYGACDDGNCD